tara:strand:- start:273 stop:542 length:270 start_codon:yes stop_codon:yes gene_type:complete
MSDQWQGGKGDRNRSNNTTFRNGWDAIFGVRETISDRDYKEVFEAPLTQVQIDRKLKEWGMMYDCLQNISLYEYPVEEAKALLKQIKIS